jgi:hypothetical protein
MLGRADRQRGRFRSFLLGALDHFLAHAAERARARKRGGNCQFVYLDDDAAENCYQLAAPARERQKVGGGYQPRKTLCRSLSRHRERTLTVTEEASQAT